jgi:hypothetical protein
MYRVLWWFDALVASVVVFFFFIGLADGSVSSFNGVLWTFILFALAAILVGSRMLFAASHQKAAQAVLLLLAMPGVCALAFFLLVMITQPRWN